MLLPHYSFEKDTLGECLLDLSVRFVINCPSEDLQTKERLFFQIEEAHWFYEDFARVDNPNLPSMKLRTFVDRLFKACPFLHQYSSDPLDALTHFQSYKSLIPVRGGIILNKKMDKVLMVKGWRSGSSWGFPKGKINKDEPDSQCAIREVYEETGFDMTPYLVEEDYFEVTRQGKNIRLYVIRGVPEDTHFETQTRKEISKISWHTVSKLPSFSKKANNNTHYYMAAPFMGGLKKYINKCKGLATSLTSTETKALKNVLGSENVFDNGFQNDEEAAKNLLSMLKPTGSLANANGSTGPTSDTTILLNLIKGDHKTTDLESAQQVLGLYRGQINAEDKVPTVEPTKIVLPEHYAHMEQQVASVATPPLPPNSMLQNLVNSRQNKHQGAGLLSILSGNKGPAPAKNNLLGLLQPQATSPHVSDQSSTKPAPSTDLMALLSKPGAPVVTAQHTAAPAVTPPASAGAPTDNKNPVKSSQMTKPNQLMDLLSPTGAAQDPKVASTPTQVSNKVPAGNALLQSATRSAEPEAHAVRHEPNNLMELLTNSNKSATSDSGIGAASQTPPAPIAEPTFATDNSLLSLLHVTPSNDPYPSEQYLLNYLAKITSV